MKKYIDIFYTFFKIGLFTFGGGYAMISVMQDLIVEHKKWIDEAEMHELISISEATPGPFAINGATFIGYKHGGFLGSLFATLGVVIPSLTVIILISIFLEQFSSNVIIQNALKGIGAGVGVLIIKAFIKMGKKVKKNWYNLFFFVLAFVVSFFTSFSVVYLILLTALFAVSYQAIKGGDISND